MKMGIDPKWHKEALIQYIRTRLELEDWHGVSDACNDIRVLEASYPELKTYNDSEAK